MLELNCGKVGVCQCPLDRVYRRMSIGCAHWLPPSQCLDAGNALGPKDMAGELIEISW
jgi:hypothetical protein